MQYFAENAAPVWAIGGLLLTMTLIVFSHTRSTGSLIAVSLVLLLTAGGLLTERLVVTQREEVQLAVLELLDRIQSNDLPGVLTMISNRQSTMAADAQTLMPMFEVRSAGANGDIEVTIDNNKSRPTASAEFHFATRVRRAKDGLEGAYVDRVVLLFVREAGEWKIDGYTTNKNWRRDASRL